MELLKIILPVALVLGLGYVSRRRALFTEAQISGLKALVCNFTLPAVVLGAFYKSAFDNTIIACAAVIFLCCLAALGLGFLVKRLLLKNRAPLPYLITGFEMGMLGYALYGMRFGSDKLTNMAIADVGQVVFVFTVYRILLALKGGERVKSSLMEMVKSPILLSVLAGLILGASGLGARISMSPAGGVVDACIEFISAPTGCVILFVVGYGMSFSASCLKDACITTLARLAVMAALFFASIWAIGLFVAVSDDLYWALALMFSLPGPFVLPLFLRKPADAEYASTALSLNTLITMALFALISAIA